MLRDKIMLNNSIFLLCAECRGCGLKDHLIEYCESVHLVINNNIKIGQHLNSKPIHERGAFLRKRKKINSLKILNKCSVSMSNFEELSMRDDEKEINTQVFERFSREEIDSTIKEASSNELPKRENSKKIQYFLTSTNTNELNNVSDSMINLKLSNPKENNHEVNLDKLQKFKYYYPDFNFKNLNNRVQCSRKLKNSISREKKKSGLF